MQRLPSWPAFLQRGMRKATHRECELADQACPICLDDLQPPDQPDGLVVIRVERCDHLFHWMCICRWFKAGPPNTTCPVCRRVLFDGMLSEMAGPQPLPASMAHTNTGRAHLGNMRNQMPAMDFAFLVLWYMAYIDRLPRGILDGYWRPQMPQEATALEVRRHIIVRMQLRNARPDLSCQEEQQLMNRWSNREEIVRLTRMVRVAIVCAVCRLLATSADRARRSIGEAARPCSASTRLMDGWRCPCPRLSRKSLAIQRQWKCPLR